VRKICLNSSTTADGDTVIENNGTLEEFKQKIIEALK